jgi:hypothetical protein
MTLKDVIRERHWLGSGRHPMSNLSMDGWSGGKLYVPPTDYDEFLGAVADAVDRNEPFFLVERRTDPVFKWHADLDIVTPTGLSDADRQLIVLRVQSAIRDALDAAGADRTRGGGLKLLILAAPARPAKGGGVKSGIHLVAPGLRVTTELCGAIQKLAVPRLQAAVPISNAWSDAYDTSVYSGSGLRMLGARKMEPCGCDGRPGGTCGTAGPGPGGACDGSGRVDAGRAYTVVGVVDAQGVTCLADTERLQRCARLAMRLASTRCFDTLQAATRAPMRRRRTGPPATQPTPRAGGATQPTLGGAPLAVDDEIARLLAERVHVELGHVQLRAPVTVHDGVVWGIRGTRFCTNVGRAHSSSNIFLHMSHAGELTQRCHCPKHGCRGYRSLAVRAPPSAIQAYLPFART